MVISKLMQGLGNQMFQYAAGRSLSLHINTSFKVNIDNYSPSSLRQYELSNYFKINPDIATQKDMQDFDLNHPVRRVWNKINSSKKIRSLPYEESNKIVKLIYQVNYFFRKPHLQKVYEEKQFHFDVNFFETNSNVFLKGYWQSWKYFEKYKDQIKQDFTVRENLVTHLNEFSAEMRNCNSIALHIRCTDKLSPTHIKLHGQLNADYYRKSVEYILSKTVKKNVCLYIFTDDIIAAKDTVPKEYKVVWVSKNITSNAIEDFYLMQQANAIITSNSTFSWWAAYLNVNKNAVVIVPEKWYKAGPYNDKDVYCQSWIKK